LNAATKRARGDKGVWTNVTADEIKAYFGILIRGERCKITKYSNEEVSYSLVRKESALNETESMKYCSENGYCLYF
jgi:hypothetical protein